MGMIQRVTLDQEKNGNVKIATNLILPPPQKKKIKNIYIAGFNSNENIHEWNGVILLLYNNTENCEISL